MMKKFKIIFFNLLLLLIFSSCQEKTDIEVGVDTITKEEDKTMVTHGIELPNDMPTPEEVLALSSNSIADNSNDDNSDIDYRRCYKAINWWNTAVINFHTNASYALWIYHYDDSDNYLGFTRHDVNSCGDHERGYDAPEDACRACFFVGYQYWGVYENDLCGIWPPPVVEL